MDRALRCVPRRANPRAFSSKDNAMKKLLTRSEIVNKLLADLAEAEAHIAPTASAITGTTKLPTLKMRKGGEKIVASIGSLAKAHGVQTSKLQPEMMSARIEEANALEPLEQRLESMLTLIKNQRFLATSDAWSMTLKFYSLLQRCAVDDSQLAASLAPVEDFFAFRHGTEPGAKQTKAQTKAKAKLANAQQLIASANARAVVRATPSPVASTPSPAPVATPVSAPSSPSLIVAAPSNVTPPVSVNSASNGASNGTPNGASNGAAYGTQSFNGEVTES
jgi:hypothetical protein